ncbi:MAG: HrcA family transcriptional regulator [Cyanobacteria bacterium K_DeepCast_35m_m2_023]|nr:HrcA family transcriptional regulator [Cyanobacteria bacterium K_DeepCast_35m_m2_023]
MQSLSPRQRQVLQATVRHYVDTTEPVGSKVLVKRFGLEASPATVRSAMGVLEQRGLLTQPHTSAGRIPSQLGYRTYVDQLLPAPGAAALQLQRELASLTLQWAALDDLLLQLARRLADLTGLLSLITPPQRRQRDLEAVRLVPSGDRLLVVVVEGAATSRNLNVRLPHGLEPQIPMLERWLNAELHRSELTWERLPAELRSCGGLVRQALELKDHHSDGAEAVVASGLGGLLSQPEFQRTASLLPLVELVESHPNQVLGPEPDDVRIQIGYEHPHQALNQCAVVQASYRCADGSQGRVALVGPMRMAYATAKAAVHSAADWLQRLLS